MTHPSKANKPALPPRSVAFSPGKGGFLQRDNGPWEWHIQETFKGLVTLSVEALKVIALVNGGAAVAILTFCGNISAKGDSSYLGNFKPSLFWYCGGLASTMVAFIVAYLTQLRLYHEEKRRHERGSFLEIHPWLIGLGVLLLIFSVIAFGMGSYAAADVISPPAPHGLRISH
jgi:hypothetical protein